MSFQLSKIVINAGILLFSSMGFLPGEKLVSALEDNVIARAGGQLDNNFGQLEMEKKGNQSLLLASKDTALEDSLWYLSYYANEKGEMVPAKVFVDNPQVRFSGGRVSGNTTCNRFSASYTLKGNNLSIKPGMTTLMSCPDEFMAQEARFLKAMEQVTSYKITNNQLQLLNKEQKVLLSFNLTVSPALINTLWQLISYNNGRGALVSIIPETNITAIFDANGGLTGFAGCNNYIASYTTKGDMLKISSAVSTRKFCGQPEGIMSQESDYLQVLETTTSFSIEDNILTLRKDSGETVAQFKTE